MNVSASRNRNQAADWLQGQCVTETEVWSKTHFGFYIRMIPFPGSHFGTLSFEIFVL